MEISIALLALAWLGGALTIVSPCILPVLPFVFARAGRPFLSSGLPMLAGMALTFALVATLAAVAGGWAVAANHYGRLAAMALLALFGVMLLFPPVAELLSRPFVRLGAALATAADGADADAGTTGAGSSARGVAASALLGVATGLLWAPCAGPVLGLILTGAALNGANVGTTLLLAAFAIGAACSLALALLAGSRVFAAMKRSLGAGEWLRRGLGVAVLAGVAAIATGLDTGLLTRLSLASTSALEERLLDRLSPAAGSPSASAASPVGGSGAAMTGSTAMTGSPALTGAPAITGGTAMTGAPTMARNPASQSVQRPSDLPDEGAAPEIDGAVAWLNSPPLAQLRGKVVLVDFWTYSCINCLRAMPYVKAWAEKYRDQGLVVIGVHAPEFAFEKNLDNVRKATRDLGVSYPVAIDNNYAIWRAFRNRYWPAHYFIDATGRVRHHKFGEGDYAHSEAVIQQLLTEAGHAPAVAAGTVTAQGQGAQAPADMQGVGSPETYLGYERAENFVSPQGVAADASRVYSDGKPRLNEWGLNGAWTIGKEQARLDAAGGSIVFRFQARDLHLVLADPGKPVRFKVLVDGKPPGADHGVDVNAAGEGVVDGQRLYQLVRQQEGAAERSFEIRFAEPGVAAYAFTFG